MAIGKKPVGKSAPAAKAPLKGPAPKGPKGAAPATPGLAAQFKEAWKKADKAATQAGFTNSEHSAGGGYTPPDGEYIFTLREGSQVITPRDKKAEGEVYYVLPLLAVEITGTDGDEGLIGKQFNVPLSLKPIESKRNPGETFTKGGGTIKFMGEQLFDAEIEDVEEAFVKIAEEGVGSNWNVRVVTDEAGYSSFYFNELITEE